MNYKEIFEKGTFEESLLNLHNIGFIMNEKKVTHVPIHLFNDLLNYTILVVRETKEYMEEVERGDKNESR